MNLCPCGCGRELVVKRPDRVPKMATRACWHRLVTPEQRAAWFARAKPRPATVATVNAPCGCGCGRTFVRPGSRRATQRFASRSCAMRYRLTAPEYAAREAARLKKAAHSKLLSAWRDIAQRVKGRTPAEAYRVGYSAGFHRAARYYRARMLRAMKKGQAA